MKQKPYTPIQEVVNDVLYEVSQLIGFVDIKKWNNVIDTIHKKYQFPKRYLTLRNYINSRETGSYHTFHFFLDGIELCMTNLGGFMTEEHCHLFKYVDKFYVIDDKQIDNGGDCTNYHCDHYLTLEVKED